MSALSDPVWHGSGLRFRTWKQHLPLQYTHCGYLAYHHNYGPFYLPLHDYSSPQFSRTALQGAAAFGHDPLVRLLLQWGAELEARDVRGCTALHWAAQCGHLPTATLLLEQAADIEARSEKDFTALHYAAMENHLPIVRLLVEQGANIEARNTFGKTACDYAAEAGHAAVVAFLSAQE
eukprot:GCRY01001312.1.p2 GENE.GCRY01001312.1~~GCRY01001312.1.p2  ORF type:complete len:178 (+),score=27.52 GCRY01001312.1:2679-3212(+)